MFPWRNWKKVAGEKMRQNKCLFNAIAINFLLNEFTACTNLGLHPVFISLCIKRVSHKSLLLVVALVTMEIPL